MTTATDFQTVTQWYEHCSEQYQDLYDAIIERLPHADKWDVEEVIEFIEELNGLGVGNASQFEDAFYTYTDEYNPEKWFAEDYFEQIGVLPTNDADPASQLYSFIDWQAVWDCLLRYDFYSFEFEGDTYFFSRNF